MEVLEANQKIAERMWKFISWEKGINPSLTDQPTSFEGAPPSYRAFCRTLAWEAMEELDIIGPLERSDIQQSIPTDAEIRAQCAFLDETCFDCQEDCPAAGGVSDDG